MANKLSRFRQLLDDARGLFEDRLGGSPLSLPRWKHLVHFWIMVGKSFARNRCPVRASALAYATALALIPMLAVVMSITSAFLKQEGEEQIDQFIVKLVANVTTVATVKTNETGAATAPAAEDAPAAATNRPQSANLSTNGTAAAEIGSTTNQAAVPSFVQAADAVKTRKAIAKYIHDFIQNTRSGTLGVTGSILLIFVAISMLARIEDTFNDIWGVAQGRSWFMRVVLYWGVISLVPVLLVVALGLATGPHLDSTKHFLNAMPFISGLVFRFLPLVVLCITFAAFYALLPNTKVQWQAALAGGLAAAVLFHLNNMISVLYVSRVVSNSKIYGSLGLVPVFMIGLYVAWLIVLFGAQVAYAYQNRSSYLEARQVETVNQRGREFVALRLMTFIGLRFARGEPAPSAAEIGSELAVPTRLVQHIMNTLCSARLVTPALGRDIAYMPARPLERITCHDVLLAMRASQGQELETRDEPTRSEVYGEFQRIEEAERAAAGTVTLRALVNRADAPGQLAERQITLPSGQGQT